MKVATWNVKWATPASPWAPEIFKRLDAFAADVICLTETDVKLLLGTGHTICCRPDYGYPIRHGRRKVMLWSREPWSEVDDVGVEALPPGRFVSGVTRTPLGDTTVIGVCIPWSWSRTDSRRGSERKARWEDHEHFLSGLAEILNHQSGGRVLVMGDFNQVIGTGSRAPHRLRTALTNAFPPSMSIVSSEITFNERKSIDHIALSGDLALESMEVISNLHEGSELSDHFGLAAGVMGRDEKVITVLSQRRTAG